MKNVVNKLAELKKAFQEVNVAWSECDNMETVSYPFEKSFDELTLNVEEWCEDFTNHLEAEIKEQNEEIPLTYGLLKRKVDWSDLHTMIGVGYYAIKEGYEIEDSEVFNIKVIDARQHNLI